MIRWFREELETLSCFDDAARGPAEPEFLSRFYYKRLRERLSEAVSAVSDCEAAAGLEAGPRGCPPDTSGGGPVPRWVFAGVARRLSLAVPRVDVLRSGRAAARLDGCTGCLERGIRRAHREAAAAADELRDGDGPYDAFQLEAGGYRVYLRRPGGEECPGDGGRGDHVGGR